MPKSYVRRCVRRSGCLRNPCESEQQVHPTKKKDNTAAKNMANEHRSCDILSLFDCKSGSDTRYSHKQINFFQFYSNKISGKCQHQKYRKTIGFFPHWQIRCFGNSLSDAQDILLQQRRNWSVPSPTVGSGKLPEAHAQS